MGVVNERIEKKLINIPSGYFCQEKQVIDYDDGLYFDNGIAEQTIFIKCPYALGSEVFKEQRKWDVISVYVIEENSHYFWLTTLKKVR